jgi:hypothetical protein
MGQEETAVTGKNRIMIYGPKNDGTYIIEFKMVAGEALRSACRPAKRVFSSISRNGCPMGSSCRMFHAWRTVVLPKRSPLSVLPPTSDEGFPRPRLRKRGRGSRLGARSFPLSGTRPTVYALVSRRGTGAETWSGPCAISPPQLTGSTTGYVGVSSLAPLQAM